MKKKSIISIVVFILVVVFSWGYFNYMSPTRIATLNFPGFTLEKIIRSNNNKWIDIESVDLDEVEKIENYDMVFVRIHGTSLTQEHKSAIQKAIEKGIPVYSSEKDNAEINSLKGMELQYISTLMSNGSVKNYNSLLNYVRTNIDRKTFFNKPHAEPIEVPSNYYFHLGDDQFFSTYEEYLEFYKKAGKYNEGAPNIVLLSGNINMQNSNSEHMFAIINSLEEKGLNVFPISSFGMKKLKMIRDAKPDVIINRPHGRLVMGGGESGTELLKSLNVPILAPITVGDLYEDWLESKQGVSSGGMTSMSVVMPELDGAIAPFAIAAQFERNGRKLYDAIPVHTEKFCSMVNNFASLSTKPNSEKKIAIYYYKASGKGALSAGGIEGVQSLYNTLVELKDNGYDVSGLPSNVKALEQQIQKEGPVLGPYALGSYDEYLKNGNPELVDTTTFYKWANQILPKKLVSDLEARYGKAPGEYMGVEKDGKQYIAVTRITYGNITILPQPLPAVGDDTEKLVHGTDGAPAYPYVASYLWTRMGFGADAMIHFGTHGSLEFIPGKQIALSDYDWTDALVGDMPHFYIYTISNIGEGIIAKRRSYATLVTHLTAPFMQGELYDEFTILKDRIHRMELMEESPIKENHRQTIMKLAKAQNIISSLGIDSTRTLTDDDIERIHMYVEEVDGAKVNDGLYTLGVPYTNENLDNTVRLMNIDPIRYSLADIDVAHGKISEKKLDNLSFVGHRYNNKTENVIKRALRGESTDRLLRGLLSKADYGLLQGTLKKEAAIAEGRRAMMAKMMGSSSKKKPLPKFLDEVGNIMPDPEPTKEVAKKPSMSQMDRMAQAKPTGVTKDPNMVKQENLVNALKKLKSTIDYISKSRSNIKNSTEGEQKALLNGLNGGFIHPSSGGDPIINPRAVPTGRNFYSINPEATPSDEAWRVGKVLAESLLASEFTAKGKYPEKISFTLWSTDFISSEGATIAQILYLLGVEPLRDGFGYIRSLRLIPIEQLGRPRIDVVIQTSGQLRDIASTRLELINRAVVMAAEANDGETKNFVNKGLNDAERRLLEKGFSPADARRFSRERIFGGVNGGYGTSIMGMVEKGDSWDDRSQIADQYIKNMGAVYSANGTEDWGAMREGVFEAALLNTSVVVQPRSSNTWGPLSLDHVYEFMGGLSAAVERVTGNDPSAYFNDFRNNSRPRMQGLKEAIGVETSSTIFNPKYIREMMKGEASSMGYFAETFRNTYGWNSMKPSAIDQHIWNKYHEIYVKDSYNMGLEKIFTEKNPYALQEMTAVMLESARKGMWKATDQQLLDVAKLHTKLVIENEAGCSGFVCDNAKLRKFISEQLPAETQKAYNQKITDAREVSLEKGSEKGVVLEKEQANKQQELDSPRNTTKTIIFAFVALCLVGGAIYMINKRRKNG